MSNLALKIENVSKIYRVGTIAEREETLFGNLANAIKAPLQSYRELRALSQFDDEDADDVLWALRDVSFDVAHGDVVGLIGRNGAGKSTLLKVLSRITEPTRGRIEAYGRIASLLEVGTGFHDDLTGRENVYLNGAILGMTKAEIDRKFDEIVAFSEIERFIDTMTKRYSSGMKVRLAFAVAAHLEPEILLVDEVLAVGDVAFQKKCLGKMDDVADEGRTVIFVSHHMSMIQALCKRGIVLQDGQTTFDGGVESAIGVYLKAVETLSDEHPNQRTDREGSGAARIADFWLEDSDGDRVDVVASGRDVHFCTRYERVGECGDIDFNMGVYDQYGVCVFNSSTKVVPAVSGSTEAEGIARCTVPRLPLPAGGYTVNLALWWGKQRLDRLERVGTFTVESGDFYNTGKIPDQKSGVALVDYTWEFDAGVPA